MVNFGADLARMDTRSLSETLQHRVGNEKRPLYLRLKRKRDEIPPPFLCVLTRKRRNVQGSCNGLSTGGNGGESDDRGYESSLSKALILKHVDSAPAPCERNLLEGHSWNKGAFNSPAKSGADTQLTVGAEEPSVAHALGLSDLDECVAAASYSEAVKEPVVARDSDSSPEVVDGTTFWKAFNAPLRQRVFGSDTPLISRNVQSESHGTANDIQLPSTCYRSVVEEAVRSVRRFKLNGASRMFPRDKVDNNASVRSPVLLASGEIVEVIDVECDSQDTACDNSGSDEHFEYDLYAVDALEGQENEWSDVGKNSRVVELLQQDCVGLVEIEDIDEETGVVSSGYHSMQAFLDEFGDIDDSCSDDAREVDYPSSASSGSRSYSSRRKDSGKILLGESPPDSFSESDSDGGYSDGWEF